MKLIKDLGTRKCKRFRRYGIFYCKYCNKAVERLYQHGFKQKSCGCASGKLISKANTTHGSCKGQRARLYNTWSNIKSRCCDLSATGYKNYGGRGITICDEWLKSFIPFKEWALNNGYKDNLEIDRTDNDKNYEPGNCQWVTHKKNNRNKRTNKLTLKEAQQIRSLHFNVKIEQKLLAKIFSVSPCTIWDIVHGKTSI